MNKQTAIQLLYLDRECSDYCFKVAGDKYIADDLLQYSFEQLLLKDEEFILSKYSDGSLKRYFAGIVYKSFHYPSSPFYIEHLKHDSVSDDYTLIDYDDDETDILTYVEEGILRKEILYYERKSEKHWAEASIFNLYLKYGNLRSVSSATKIPVKTLHDSIKNIKSYLRYSICEKYF